MCSEEGGEQPTASLRVVNPELLQIQPALRVLLMRIRIDNYKRRLVLNENKEKYSLCRSVEH